VIIQPISNFTYKVALIDYGMSNLASIQNSLIYLGINPIISSDPTIILSAEFAILPGVGAFGEAIRNIHSNGLFNVIKELHYRRTPLLGICLGMQLLASFSTENGFHEGLCIIPGAVDKLTAEMPVPHVGWNTAVSCRQSQAFMGISTTDFYFIHSYHFKPDDPDSIVTKTDYGETFASSVQLFNTIGVQFHPEKSHRAGLQFLKNFFVNFSCKKNV